MGRALQSWRRLASVWLSTNGHASRARAAVTTRTHTALTTATRARGQTDAVLFGRGIMSRSRASAVIAAFATTVAMAVGAVTLTSAAASAAPAVHYPPPPPRLVVNHGVVRVGAKVHATGRRFASRETV